MKTKYGHYSHTQINSTKTTIRKSIFFLLLYVDPKTKDEYPNINVEEAFLNIQYKLDGLNSILFYPQELVETMCLLEAALKEYKSDNFNFQSYRKLILDAGSEIMKVGDS